jgi:hypothetical protein
MKNKNLSILLLVLLAAGCEGTGGRFDPNVVDKRDQGTAANPNVVQGFVPQMDPKRKVSEQDCSRPVDTSGGNLMCKGEPTAAEREAERRRLEEEERQRRLAAERRARMEEAERQAKAQREAEERAAREAAERERAELAARDAAALQARLAEEAALAAALKAREERERLAREEAEARARERAEQEARAAAELERQRQEQAWLEGRALLEKFVANYGKVEKFKDVSEPITGFLDKTR